MELSNDCSYLSTRKIAGQVRIAPFVCIRRVGVLRLTEAFLGDDQIFAIPPGGERFVFQQRMDGEETFVLEWDFSIDFTPNDVKS